MAKKEMKFGKFSIGILIAFFACFLFLLYWNTRAPGTEDIVLKDDHLQVYVAKTLKDMYVGLGGRENLDGKDGMLFLYDFPDKHGIVMRDMLFSIDVVWLYDGQVVDIAPALPLEPEASEFDLTVYRPRTEATMVLELPAGWSAKHDLKIGDRISLP